MPVTWRSTNYIAFRGFAVLACQHAPHAASGATSVSPQRPSASAHASPALSAAAPAPDEWHYTVAATIGPGSEVPDTVRVRSQADCPTNMVFIPEGDLSYLGMLPDKKDQTLRAQHFRVKAFCIDRTEPADGDWGDLNGQCGARVDIFRCHGPGSGPMSCVTPEQAECFCEKGTSGIKKRLPTDPEWLFAALGTDGRKYPWGNDPSPADATNHNFCAERGPPPGRFSSGEPDWLCPPSWNTADKSPFGVLGMATNGFEMNATCVRTEETPAELSCLVRFADIAGDEAQANKFPGLAAVPDSVYQLGPVANRVASTRSFRCATSQRISN